MKIVGGTFVTEPAFEGAMFSAQGDSVQLIGVTLKAPALDKVPSIFVENGAKTNSKDSNVMSLYSNGHEGITLVDCTTDKIIPAKINNGSGTIKNCTVKDCSMFIWATNCRMTVECNEVSICDTGLNTIVFKNGNTCSYLMECMKFTGVCHDNAVTGAKTTKWWNIDRGNTYSNTINGITAT